MIVETEYGTVNIKSEVVKDIVYKAVMESYGTVDMGKQGFFDKLANLWIKEESKGISVIEEEGKIVVNLDLVLEYGLPVKKVAENTQENVYHRIESMLNYNDVVVNVHIAGLKF
ncbi:MAG: Asp23/Gls24 family envelope stress response protein [Thermotogae bacterium]|nr:Asp23/Gls24 family envelope stress response protein [Thermotogota bacterium]MCP5465118.1 Asp23/Gls24 family envelope stress response protein [Thermotogota bacterium]HOO74841.1 Asp23/Gls24 family envelope stress response protein [Tepiditoga sp.]